MRNLVVIVVLLMAMQSLAFAATGHKAKLTTTVEFGEEMLAMMEAMAAMGGGEAGAVMEGLEPVVVHQTVYWSEAGMRMDTLAEGGVEATVIYDYANGVMYQFTSADRVATMMDLGSMAGAGEGLGMFFAGEMGAFADFDSAIAQMQSEEHMVVNKLADKTISGLLCQGFSFSMDMEALMAESEGSGAGGEAGMAMGMLGGMGEMGGEVWIHEGLGFPVSYVFTVMGSTTSMSLSDVEDWTVDAAMLAVPEGYEIKEFEMPDFSDMGMPDFGDMEMPEGHAIPEGA